MTGITITGAGFRLQALLRSLAVATNGIGEASGPGLVHSDCCRHRLRPDYDLSSAQARRSRLNLTGSGISPSFTYQLVNANPPVTLGICGWHNLFPGTNVGQTSNITVRVLTPGPLAAPSIPSRWLGQGYQFATQPVVPQTLSPNASLTFTVTFAPTQPGSFPGTLRSIQTSSL